MMSDLISHTARLVPYARRPKHMPSYVTAYMYEPAADEIGARLGNFFVVVEVLISGRASEEVVDLIIQTAGDKYYNEPADELDPLARFEAAIKQTNHELSEYVGRGNAAWIGKLSAIIAVQAGSELHVAQTGSGEAFLYRGKAVSRISVTDNARPATPSKTFGSIATGELETGDKLLLATPALVHQIPLKQLQSVITSLSPNMAIQEFSQLLEGAVTNRVSAIIVEITTPELAALKVRSDQPDEIELGNRETFTEAAVAAAVPLAQTTAHTSRRAAQLAADTWSQTRPHLRRASLAAADAVRRTLSTKRGRYIALAGLIVIVAVITVSSLTAAGNKSRAKTFAQYQALYGQFTKAQTIADAGNKNGARTTLADIQIKLKTLAPSQSLIDGQLKNNPLPQGEPTSFNSFKNLVADTADQLDGLIKVSPMTVAEIGGKNGRPTHLESDGTHAYVFDAANKNAISIVNLQTGTQEDSKADTSVLGDVKATTLSANKDGIFILTSKPSVWFYKFASDSLSQQTVAYDSWPAANAIASYGSNLYLLGDGVIYKHVRNATGWSPKSTYIPTTSTSPNAGSLAVDGYIYLSSSAGLQRYLGPILKQTLTVPASLGQLTNLRSVADGDLVMAASSTSGRLAVWSANDDSVAFDKQIAIQDVKSLTDATYDAKLGKMFATTDNRLVSFPFKP